jgi:hypothetical protein
MYSRPKQALGVGSFDEVRVVSVGADSNLFHQGLKRKQLSRVIAGAMAHPASFSDAQSDQIGRSENMPGCQITCPESASTTRVLARSKQHQAAAWTPPPCR